MSTTEIFTFSPRLPMVLPDKICSAGSQTEAMSSVFRGICETNCLAMRAVLKKVNYEGTSAYLPQVSSEYPLYATNHGGKVAEDLDKVIRVLAGYEAVKMHSFAAWNARDPKRPLIGVTEYRKWCPQCYLDDARSGGRIYDRLAWMPSGVEVCVTHGTRLDSHCPNCGKHSFRFLRNNDVSGYCPKCLAWLGGQGRPYPREHDDLVQYHWWIASCVNEMLERRLSLDIDPLINIAAVIRALINLHFSDNVTRASLHLGRAKSLVSEWRNSVVTPRWDALCNISYGFQVSIHALLTGDMDAIAFSSLARLPSSIVYDRPKSAAKNRSIDYEGMQRFMLEIIAGKHPTVTKFRQICERYQVERWSPKKRFPEISAKVAVELERRRKAKATQLENGRVIGLRQEVVSVARDFAAQQKPIRRRSLVNELTLRGCIVRRGDYKWTLDLAKQTASYFMVGSPQEHSEALGGN